MVARAVEEFGHVDIMCNNAAAPGTDLWIWEQTLENWNATIAIDVTAAMLCTREVLNQSMLERRSGVILNFSSTAGYNGDASASRTTSRPRRRCARSPRPSRSRSGRTASAATASCPAASTPSCGRTGSRRMADEQGVDVRRAARPHAAGCRAARHLLDRGRRQPRARSSRATRAAPSPGSRSRSTPGGTCRDEHANRSTGDRVPHRDVRRPVGRRTDRSRIWRGSPRPPTGSATTTSRAASTSRCRFRRRGRPRWRATGIRSPPSATSRPAPSASVSRRTCSCSAYHHPLEIAKRYGTLDRRQRRPGDPRGRRRHAEGGVRPHRRALRRPRATRRRRAAGAAGVALQCACRSTTAPFYDFEGFVVDPCAVQEHVPIWVGGRTLRSLRRAADARRRLVPVRGPARPGRRVAPARRASVRLRRGPPADGAARPHQRTREDPGDPGRHRGVGRRRSS